MTRVTPNPGQIAQIQTTGVAAQQIGQVRPGSPPPPDLSRLNRFADLSRSVAGFLDAYGDNDRLKSRQEADAAFAQMPQEIREKLSSGDPKDRIAALDGYLDGLVKSGQFNRADHPRFRNQFYAQAARAEVNDLATRLEGRLSDAQAIYDENGSFVGEADPESILAEEMEAMKGAVALSDPFAVRQVGGELLQVQESFRSAFGKARSQAMEQAARDEVKDSIYNLVNGIVEGSFEDGGMPIESADLSGAVRAMEDAVKKYGFEDGRRLGIAAFQTAIGELLANDKPEAADALLDRLEALRDTNRNPIIRDTDSVDLVSGLRERIGVAIERKEDEDYQNEERLYRRNLRSAQGDLLVLAIGGQREGKTFAQIEAEGYARIQQAPSEVQGVLMDSFDNLLENEKREAFQSDPEVLENFKAGTLNGSLAPEEVYEALDTGEITADDANALLADLTSQESMEQALPASVQEILESTVTEFQIEGATSTLRAELELQGRDRQDELRNRLTEYWLENGETAPGVRDAGMRRIAREFRQETREIVRAEQEDFLQRSTAARQSLLQKRASLTLTEADILNVQGDLPQEVVESLLDSLPTISARRADLRAKSIAPYRSRLNLGLEAFSVDQGLDPSYDPLLSTLRQVYEQELEGMADRFEAEVLPNTDPSRVQQAYTEFMRAGFNEDILPKLDPVAAEIVSRIEEGVGAVEAVETVRSEQAEPDSVVDVERYPELTAFASAQGPARLEAAKQALVKADPERQAEVFLQLAPRLGIKADEVLRGQIAVQTTRLVRVDSGPRISVPDRGTVVPIEVLASSTTAKYQTPLFTSVQEFQTFATERPGDMEEILNTLGIPPNRHARWQALQKAAIERVHSATE